MVVQGKGNLLDEIQKYDPDLPGNYTRVRGDNLDLIKIITEVEQEISSREKRCLIRSDSTCEDTLLPEGVATFAGMHYTADSIDHTNIQEAIITIATPLDLAKGNLSDIARRITQLSLNNGQMAFRKDVTEEDVWSALMNSPDSNGVVDLDVLLHPLLGEYDDRSWRMFVLQEMIMYGMDLREYAQGRGVNLSEARMDYIIHEKEEGPLLLAAEHPNLKDTFIVDHEDGGYRVQTPYNYANPSLYHNPFTFKESAIVDIFSSVVRDLRSEGKLHEKYAYMCEGIVGRRPRIVQLRPYFPLQMTDDDREEDLLGVAPQEGFEFRFDPVSQSYPGLVFKEFKQNEDHLPYDVKSGVPTRLICSQWPKFLSHSGLRHIERASCAWMGFLESYKGTPKLHFSIEEGCPRLTPI